MANQTVYTLFYNHDDNYDIETLLGIYASLDGAKAAAQQEHINHKGDAAEPLKWERMTELRGVAYQAFRDKYNELFFQVVAYEVEPGNG